ncbi:MAG: hypothetical protein WC992_04025 [Acholeplasmataceae bacterium]|jgi:hypothetical protein
MHTLDLRRYQLAALLWWVLGWVAAGPQCCAPSAMAFLNPGLLLFGIIGSLASTVYAMYSSRQQGKAQAKAAKDEARYRAKQAENAAEQERLNRIASETDERRAVQRRRARIEGAYAKAGVLLSGTPSDYLAEQAATDELNIQRARQGSELRQQSLLHQGQVASIQGATLASAYKSGATQQMIGQGLSGAASLLSMGSQVSLPSSRGGTTAGGAGGTAPPVPIAQPGAVLSSPESPFASLAGPSWASGSDYYFDITTGF